MSDEGVRCGVRGDLVVVDGDKTGVHLCVGTVVGGDSTTTRVDMTTDEAALVCASLITAITIADLGEGFVKIEKLEARLDAVRAARKNARSGS